MSSGAFFFFFTKTSCAPHVFIVSGLIGFLLVEAFSVLISGDLSDCVLHTEGKFREKPAARVTQSTAATGV